MIRIYLYAGIATAILALGWYAHHRIWIAATVECNAKHAIAQVKVLAEQERREQASSKASGSMLDYLAANLPPIETTTHEATERVRIVYRDHPVPGVCSWPDGVRAELDQARLRANATPGGL
jgi:hypothetical protein